MEQDNQPQPGTPELSEARATIDRVDHALLDLIEERLAAAEQIGSHKRSTDRDLYDPGRERQVLDAWGELAEQRGLSRYFTGRILREILNYSRRRQEHPELEPRADRRVVTIGYQGAPGAYSDAVADRLFALRGCEVGRRIGYPTFGDLGEALSEGDIDYAVLPVENSTSGSVDEAGHLLASGLYRVVDEDYQDVEHCLVGLPGATAETIRVIRSHPVALRQCRRALHQLTHAQVEPWHDTAGAADSIVELGDLTTAAICSAEAAETRGLTILRRGLADHNVNQTRFVLLAREAEDCDPNIPSKCSLLLSVDHRSGALVRCLNVFATHGVNLSRLQSRPAEGRPWEYMFFVDVDGHIDDPTLHAALDDVRAEANSLRSIGCYPDRSLERADVLVTPRGSSAPKQHKVAAPIEPPPPAPAPKVNAEPSLVSRRPGRERSIIEVGRARFGGDSFALILGPCAVENPAQIQAAAEMVKERGAVAMRGGAFKPRSSPYSFQGLGMEGVDLLVRAGHDHELPVVTEVLRVEDVEEVASRVDMLQIGARNMQNFELLKEVGRCDRPIILKRGLSATIKELLQAAEYVLAAGNQRVILCERGIRTFETAVRSTLDVSAIPVLKERTHLPIIVDPSHAAGRRELVVPLALAAVAAGADGLIVECHPNPSAALCDKDQALTGEDLDRLVAGIDPILRSQGRSWPGDS